jgi:hypothetical protein
MKGRGKLQMTNKLFALAISLAVTGVLAGHAFADNGQNQNSSGAFSPNTSTGSNSDFASDNYTDTNNYQPIGSFNDGSVNNSGNISVPITDSFNDNSGHVRDSHDDNSVNQAASGQVNLNYSDAGDINAADHTSTIFDGDVNSLSVGLGEIWQEESYGGGSNINTGIANNSIQGDYSAQFTNAGVGLNDASVSSSSVNSGATSNINVLTPTP